jgi:hypothetical protein
MAGAKSPINLVSAADHKRRGSQRRIEQSRRALHPETVDERVWMTVPTSTVLRDLTICWTAGLHYLHI